MPIKKQIKRETRWLTGVALAAISFAAQAVPISGEIGFIGSFTPVDSASTGTTLDVATGLDFTDDQALIVNAVGDFTGLAFTLATFTDFQFDPLTAPVSPLWTAGVFAFELQSVVVVQQTATALELRGAGVISGGGFDATSGNWAFTGDTSGSGGSGAFAWSAGTAATSSVPVSEPGLLALLGFGLVGLGAARRPRSAQQA